MYCWNIQGRSGGVKGRLKHAQGRVSASAGSPRPLDLPGLPQCCHCPGFGEMMGNGIRPGTGDEETALASGLWQGRGVPPLWRQSRPGWARANVPGPHRLWECWPPGPLATPCHPQTWSPPHSQTHPDPPRTKLHPLGDKESLTDTLTEAQTHSSMATNPGIFGAGAPTDYP